MRTPFAQDHVRFDNAEPLLAPVVLSILARDLITRDELADRQLLVEAGMTIAADLADLYAELSAEGQPAAHQRTG